MSVHQMKILIYWLWLCDNDTKRIYPNVHVQHWTKWVAISHLIKVQTKENLLKAQLAKVHWKFNNFSRWQVVRWIVKTKYLSIRIKSKSAHDYNSRWPWTSKHEAKPLTELKKKMVFIVEYMQISVLQMNFVKMVFAYDRMNVKPTINFAKI